MLEKEILRSGKPTGEEGSDFPDNCDLSEQDQWAEKREGRWSEKAGSGQRSGKEG